MEETNDILENDSNSQSGEAPVHEEVQDNETAVPASSTPTVSDHQYSMNVSDYQLGPVIGFGSSAVVHMAKYVPLQMDVAIKMIELDHFERNRIDELRKEIQVMAFCKHPNLLRNLNSFVHESKLWIVTPFLAGGSCLDIMKSGFKDGFEESVIATILFQALQGLEYLHENGHIHRDVKCGNLLMAEDGLVQLADFGVSSSLMEDGERHGVRKTYVGTPCWMAPEVMEITRGYDFKADIWSFGITALELAYGHAPYSKFPPMKVIYLTLSGKPPTLDKKQAARKYSRTFKDMIDFCLQRDPSKRPTAKALLKHPFFRSMAKKPQYLMGAVLSHVVPVNLRDKSAQLRARGLPVPTILSDDAANNLFDGSKFVDNSSEFAVEFNDNEDSTDSWDFSLDNSVEPTTFDVIAEEEEEDLLSPTEAGEKSKSSHVPLTEAAADPLPDARSLEGNEATNAEEGLQTCRTSRFILAAEEGLKEALDKLDLAGSATASEPDLNEIVGALGGESSVNSTASTPIGSSSSSSSSDSALLNVPNSQARSSSPNDDGFPNEVKKGRFSVLEAINSTDEDPVAENESIDSGSLLQMQSGTSSNPNVVSAAAVAIHEEEKRSRFEISANVPATDLSDSEEISVSAAADSNTMENQESNVYQSSSYPTMYHSSTPMISVPNFAPYPIAPHHHSNQMHPQYVLNNPPPNQQHPSTYYQHPHQSGPYHPPPPSTGMSGQHFHRPSLTSIPAYPHLHSPHQGPNMPPSAPLSPVNPVQLDHLLHVNDYIRNQLVELKYRQDMLQLQQQQQQQQQHHHHYQSAQLPQGMRPHSSFNPHVYTSNSAELQGPPPQLHHSHPTMPPLVDSHNYYCCPNPSLSSNHASLSNSVSPVPAELSTSSSGNNANISYILKELENMKRENEILKSFLHQQQQNQNQQ